MGSGPKRKGNTEFVFQLLLSHCSLVSRIAKGIMTHIPQLPACFVPPVLVYMLVGTLNQTAGSMAILLSRKAHLY